MREQSQAKVLACPGKDGIFDVGLFQHLFRFVVSSSFFAVGEERSLGFGRVLSLLLKSLSGKDCEEEEEEEEEELCLPSRGGSNYL